MSFIAALKLELQQIEAQLAKDPAFRRAARIRELLADYEGVEAATEVRATPRQPISKGTKFQRIRDELTRLMTTHGSVHRKVLLDQLVAAGLMGSEKDPMASLAHFLTTSGYFKNDGAGNWSLK